jgi:hypothetical protein
MSREWKLVVALALGLVVAAVLVPEIALWAVVRMFPPLRVGTRVPPSWLVAVAAAADSEPIDVRDRTPLLGVMFRQRRSLAGILGYELARCATEDPLGLPSDWGRMLYGVALAREFEPAVLAGTVLEQCKWPTKEGSEESLAEFGERRLGGARPRRSWDAGEQLFVFVVGMSGFDGQWECHARSLQARYAKARESYCLLEPASCSLVSPSMPLLGSCSAQ